MDYTNGNFSQIFFWSRRKFLYNYCKVLLEDCIDFYFYAKERSTKYLFS